jgi:hypothetical protein
VKNYHMKNATQHCAALLGLGLLALQPLSAGADEQAGGEQTFHGIPVTGVNSVLGQPLFSWGEPFGASFNFPTMGVFNEGSAFPLPLDSSTPSSAILASYVDPMFLALFGKPADYMVAPGLMNVRLRDVAVNIDFALAQKAPLPGIRDAHPLQLSQAEPSNDITVGQWLAASGVAKVTCTADGGADVRLHMKNLVPNRMYSVWATMGLPPQPGSTVPQAFPIPLGGAPNTFMTNENGDATFKRWLKFCPLDTQSAGSPMLFVDVQFTANHQTWGAVVAPGFIDGNWPGIITFSHLIFPMNVELLNQ